MKKTLFAITSMACAITVVALAWGADKSQPAKPSEHDMHHGMHHAAPPSNDPVIRAYTEANAKMHRDMAIPLTGDADRDFVAGMIPHHQGAIDMAKVVLQYGKDPAIRKLSEEIIAAQEKEIAFMREWMNKQGK